MAEIFLGTQHGAAGFERPVVLKRVQELYSASPRFRNMFVDEAHIAMSLTQGNIVQVLDLGVADGCLFLVLELVDGWDLNRILNRAQDAGLELPVALALHVCAEVARALAYAHGCERNGRPLGIVHRDVSPQNVLVSEQGEVKLSDFGIARAADRLEQTVTGQVKGKIGFMSPEQASGRPLDTRSDVFSLGATLYVMVTGRRPFAGASDLETLLRTQSAQYAPPLEARPDLHPAVADLITKAMQLDPAARYQTAEEMLLELERVQWSALRPAGQTQLKAWLQLLGARDGEQPISRARPAPAPTAASGGERSVIVLGEEDLSPVGQNTRVALGLGPVGATIVAPPGVPADPAPAPRALAEAELIAALRPRWDRLIVAGALVVVIAVLGLVAAIVVPWIALRPGPPARPPVAAVVEPPAGASAAAAPLECSAAGEPLATGSAARPAAARH